MRKLLFAAIVTCCSPSASMAYQDCNQYKIDSQLELRLQCLQANEDELHPLAGIVTIQSEHRNLPGQPACLTSNFPAPNTDADTGPCDGQTNQQWTLQPVK
jgi:hypothetical protein